MGTPGVIQPNMPSMAGLNPNDPATANLIRAMMQAQYQQQSAQQMQEEGSQDPGATQFVPAANQYAPAMAIKQSPLLGLSRALERGMGAYMSRNAMQKQIELQLAQNAGLWQRAFPGQGAPAQPSGASSGNAALASALKPTGAGGMPLPMATPKGLQYAQMMQESGGNPNAVSPKGAAGIMQIMPPTWANPGFGVQPGQGATRKIASGKFAGMDDPASAPIAEQMRMGNDYEHAMEQRYGSTVGGLAGYNAGPGTMDKVLAGQMNLPAETAAYVPAVLKGAGQDPAQAFGLGGQSPQAAPEAPPPAVGPLSTGAPQSQFDPSVYAARNAISPAMGEAYLKANGPQPPTPEMLNAQASGQPSPLAYDEEKARAVSGANASNEPATITDVNGQTHQTNKYNLAHQNDLVQSPAQAEGAKTAQTNVQSYREGLNKKVSAGATNVRFTNDEEDMMAHFHPGASETELAQAAAAAKRLGASDALVNQIANGDQSAVGAVQAFGSMQAMHGAEQSLEMLANGGNGQPRIAASTLQAFTKNLADPNQQENAVKAINAVTRQLYEADLAEQQAAYADKGDPTTFQSRYAAQIAPALLAGRATDPAAAIKMPEAPNNQTHLTAPPLMANRVKGQIYQTPKGPAVWTGAGWQLNAQ